MDTGKLKRLLLGGDAAFWPLLKVETDRATAFEDVLVLSTLRKKAQARQLAWPGGRATRLRVALLGGYSLFPLSDLLEHFSLLAGTPCEFWQGSYDNYIAEIKDAESELYAFAPEVILVLPSEAQVRYGGNLLTPATRSKLRRNAL